MVLGILLALPALAGAALLVSGRRADTVAAPLAVAVAVLLVGLGVAAAVTAPTLPVAALPSIGVAFAVDGLAAVGVTTVTAVFAAVAVFSVGDLGPNQARARYHGFLLLFASAMLATVTAVDLLGLLVAWEVMGAVSYALIAYWWRDPARGRSAAVAFLTTRTADLGMYLAAGAALAGGAAALELAALPGLGGAWRDAAVAGLLVAALGKSAQLPFSFWLSRAMAGPTPVSALLHSATMVAAGGYLLLRVHPALAATGWAASASAWIGVLTALLMGAVAYVQRDLKQLLAASTCSQLGFVVLAAGVGALGGGALQFAAHAAAKSLLFLSAGAWLTTLGTQDLRELRGAARRRPLVGAVFSVGALAVGGLPPLAVWVAKDEVLAAALAASGALYAAGLAASAVSAAYAARALVAVWSAPAPRSEAGRVPASERIPLPVLAAAG
ncbi:proton-conducting transporter transmembrane domain-containing protein, partial [Thermobifida halotolerans]|uniref:proton-conducting transporter transmembrane domain-containing protein n=1 Tax=Thermobifida halotolerans TaxID=483545 RepID=UPI001F31D45C